MILENLKEKREVSGFGGYRLLRVFYNLPLVLFASFVTWIVHRTPGSSCFGPIEGFPGLKRNKAHTSDEVYKHDRQF